MIVTLQFERIRTIGQVAAFVEASEPVDFQPADRKGAYELVARILSRLGYYALDRPSKTRVKRFLSKTTGYSRAQITRLIRQHGKTGRVADRRDGNQGRPFERVYTPVDARLLARVGADLGQMSGLATRVVLHREFHVFGDARFERLAGISASHIYNLRGSRTYRTRRTVVVGTRAGSVAVGERRAPRPDGQPGFLRVDTVHQGDRDGANVVRRFLGHEHIPRHFAPLVDAFAREYLSPYLNYHRPCLFASEREGANGRIRRVYRARDVCAPYEKLRSLPGAGSHVKPGVTFAGLDAEAHAISDLRAARALNAARNRLFQTIGRDRTAA